MQHAHRRNPNKISHPASKLFLLPSPLLAPKIAIKAPIQTVQVSSCIRHHRTKALGESPRTPLPVRHDGAPVLAKRKKQSRPNFSLSSRNSLTSLTVIWGPWTQVYYPLRSRQTWFRECHLDSSPITFSSSLTRSCIKGSGEQAGSTRG